jgi:hypothetical protein
MRTPRIVMAFVLAALATSAAAQNDVRATVQQRAEVFKAAVKDAKSAKTDAELAAALRTAARLYDRHIPADFGNVAPYSDAASQERVVPWYQLAVQETMILSEESRGLTAVCARLKDKNLSAAPAREAAAAAKRFLKFLDGHPWPDSFRGPILSPEVRGEHARAVKRWEKLAACAAPARP